MYSKEKSNKFHANLDEKWIRSLFEMKIGMQSECSQVF